MVCLRFCGSFERFRLSRVESGVLVWCLQSAWYQSLQNRSIVTTTSRTDNDSTRMSTDELIDNMAGHGHKSSSVSAEEFLDDCDKEKKKNNSSHKKKEKHTKHTIPSHIKSQIKSLPDVKDYIKKLLHKIQSQEKDNKKLKRKAKNISDRHSTSTEKEQASREDISDSRTDDMTSSPKCEQPGADNNSESVLTQLAPEKVENSQISNGINKDDSTTEPSSTSDWGLEAGVSLADQVREAAESVLQQSGFVYQESLGLYYDRSTGYYYDQNSGLYYDGINKTYYTYDEESHLFHVYHQIDTSAKDAEEEEIANWEYELKKRKKELRSKQRKKKPRKEESEEEEGQCSESTESDNESCIKTSNPTNDPGFERLIPAEEVAPCMRLMVLETEIKSLRVGTLFLVTCTGGTLGREGSGHAVCIPDINVSKHHAKFTFDKGQYLLCDLGSRNGTFLDGTRLSVALQESEPKVVQHGSELRVGCTKIRCHIHPGIETCGHCEPGLVLQDDGRGGKAELVDKEAKHRDELLRLRRRFALTGQQEPDVVAAAEKAGYQDRAGKRRQTVGSLHHGAKTETASLEQAVPESNKGFKLLSKMGWQSGQALGKDGTGTTEPIPLQMRVAKAGLGSDSVAAPIELSKVSKRKQEAWSKTRDRYQQLPESDSTFEKE